MSQSSVPEFLSWSATRMAGALQSGELSTVDVTEACLARMEGVNPAINAVVQMVADRAMAEAEMYDRQG